VSTSAAEVTRSQQVDPECAVLLHGLGRTELSMKALQWELEEAGYTVANLTYPSLSYPIEELALMAVEEGLAECWAQGVQHIHFVTHSLGGILLRQYLTGRDIPGLHRVVMLGPPNQGSHAADYVYSLEFLQPFMPVAVEQLGTGEQSVPLRLGPVSFELGIIAGTANRRSGLPGVPQGASDGTVAAAETVVPGMLDYLEMPVTHTFMMWNDAVLRQVLHFLRYGSFTREVQSAAGS
jgi:triacylglycerol lipase